MSGIDHARVSSYHFYINRDRLIHFLDPDASTCEALSVLFRLEGFQTTFSTDTASFFAGLQRRAPDVAAINLTLGAEDGVDVLRRVKAMHAGTVVFMLCNGTEVELAVQAMKAGAYGVVVKPIAQEPFLHEVAEALRVNVHVGPIADSGIPSIEVRGFAKLTPRERVVLQHIVDGRSNKEAGIALGISARTVEVHRARIMEKLGARNTAHLVRIVLTG
jgi:two-component system response regulator FixJ